jgi:hypothetical protein
MFYFQTVNQYMLWSSVQMKVVLNLIEMIIVSLSILLICELKIKSKFLKEINLYTCTKI